MTRCGAEARPATCRGFPIVAALALLAVAISVAPSAFEYDRAAIDAGQLWRLITCQWTHWSANHLAWDLAVFVVLGYMCERRHGAAFVRTVAAATVVVPIVVHVACRGIDVFRGLSGIDAALVGLLVASLFIAAARARSIGGQVVAGGVAIGFFAKCLYEQVSGHTVFAAASDQWRVVPLSHLAGFCCGIAAVAVGAIRLVLRSLVGASAFETI